MLHEDLEIRKFVKKNCSQAGISRVVIERPHKKCRVTILGLTFKENCPDLRNSKVVDVIRELKSFDVDVQVCDPQAEEHEAVKEYGIKLIALDELQPSEAVVIAVAHKEFVELGVKDFQRMLKQNSVIFDVKGICNKSEFLETGISFFANVLLIG